MFHEKDRFKSITLRTAIASEIESRQSLREKKVIGHKKQCCRKQKPCYLGMRCIDTRLHFLRFCLIVDQVFEESTCRTKIECKRKANTTHSVVLQSIGDIFGSLISNFIVLKIERGESLLATMNENDKTLLIDEYRVML